MGAKGAESGGKGRQIRRPFSASSIRVKWPPKLDPVKRRPPTARRFYLAELTVHLGYIFVTSLSQSTHSFVWISSLNLMASTYSQPIAHSYPHASTVKPSFQFSKPPSSYVSLFGCAARLNPSAMDVPASIDGRRFQAPPAVGQPLPPACAAELSEDGEILSSDDDDDLPPSRRSWPGQSR
jgi:hypothetical protein